MSLTIKNIYEHSTGYRMKLLAGQGGMDNFVEWVHIIETEDCAKFLHGQELVITEGILIKGQSALVDFVKMLDTLGASGLIINTGKFINEIPHEVLDLCNEKCFPLFSIPWEVPLVDVTRKYCQRIIDNAAREETITSAFKNLIFNTGDQEALIHQMERYGYRSGSEIMMICISLDGNYETEQKTSDNHLLKRLTESIANTINNQYLSFEYQKNRILALIDYSQEEIDRYIDSLFKRLSAEGMLSYTYLGMGDNMRGLSCQDINFKHAYAACEIACKKQEHILGYGKLGIYKLLVNVEDIGVLSDFYKDSFGKLIEFDQRNRTEYYKFLKTYIECNGHQGTVSDILFIHRNTVMNYIKKAGEIMDIDILSMEGKSRLYAAYCIENLI